MHILCAGDYTRRCTCLPSSRSADSSDDEFGLRGTTAMTRQLDVERIATHGRGILCFLHGCEIRMPAGSMKECQASFRRSARSRPGLWDGRLIVVSCGLHALSLHEMIPDTISRPKLSRALASANAGARICEVEEV